MTRTPRNDPMERLIEAALIDAGIDYATEDQPANVARLDFYLPEFDLYIEVKRMHTPRTAEQMRRADNVIVAQGAGAVAQLARMLRGV